MTILLIIIHLAAVFAVTAARSRGILHFPVSMFPAVFILPFWGTAFALVAEAHMRRGEKADEEPEQGRFGITDEVYRSIRMDKDDMSGVLPIGDVLETGTPVRRRSLLLSVLHEGPAPFVKPLRLAGVNDDTEVVHYAVTALSELRSEFEQRIEEMAMLRVPYKTANTPPDGDWARYCGGPIDFARDSHAWFVFTADVPETGEDEAVWLRFTTGREGQWDAQNPQGTVFIDGDTAVQGAAPRQDPADQEAGKDLPSAGRRRGGGRGGPHAAERDPRQRGRLHADPQGKGRGARRKRGRGCDRYCREKRYLSVPCGKRRNQFLERVTVWVRGGDFLVSRRRTALCSCI